MDRFMLSVIAMITMLIDHIGWHFIDEPMKLTWIGRIAFPLYAFMLADGFLTLYKDSNRLRKHIIFLLILVIISEPGYDLMNMGLNFNEYFKAQSNIISLLL